MPGSIFLSETQASKNRKDSAFSLSSIVLSGKLLHEYILDIIPGKLGKYEIPMSNYRLIQHRDIGREAVYYILPTDTRKVIQSFDTLGEAVGALIDETLGEN